MEIQEITDRPPVPLDSEGYAIHAKAVQKKLRWNKKFGLAKTLDLPPVETDLFFLYLFKAILGEEIGQYKATGSWTGEWNDVIRREKNLMVAAQKNIQDQEDKMEVASEEQKREITATLRLAALQVVNHLTQQGTTNQPTQTTKDQIREELLAAKEKVLTLKQTPIAAQTPT